MGGRGVAGAALPAGDEAAGGRAGLTGGLADGATGVLGIERGGRGTVGAEGGAVLPIGGVVDKADTMGMPGRANAAGEETPAIKPEADVICGAGSGVAGVDGAVGIPAPDWEGVAGVAGVLDFAGAVDVAGRFAIPL